MSQSYPGPPGYFPAPPLMLRPVRRYRPLRRITTAFLVLVVLTLILTVVQAVLMWRSYDDVKRFVYGLLSDDEARSRRRVDRRQRPAAQPDVDDVRRHRGRLPHLAVEGPREHRGSSPPRPASPTKAATASAAVSIGSTQAG